MNNSVREMCEYGTEILLRAGIDNARNEAAEMCMSVLKIDRTALLLYPERPVSAGQNELFSSMLSRRISGEPLQYVLGEWSFFGRRFSVGEGVLIPRPETEQLVDICTEKIKQSGAKIVFDLCAGSGCIGITVAAECPDTEVYLFELYDGAFEYLKKNAAAYKNTKTHLVKCDILKGIPEGLPVPDAIISNPPYIPAGEIAGLQKEVLREPSSALDGGVNGLDFYFAIAEKWIPLISAGGFAAVECGEGQAERISEIFSAYGKSKPVSDFYGAQRFVILDRFPGTPGQ